MASYGKMDKINVLAMLGLNGNNVLKTSRELGIARTTLLAWQKQLESDMKLLSQVERTRANFADLEELNALKASGELSRRLDETPSEIRDSDLVKIKDSSIGTSRLLRGQATQIVQAQISPEENALEFLKLLLTKTNGNLQEALAALRQASLEPLVSNYTQNAIADKVAANPKLLEAAGGLG